MSDHFTPAPGGFTQCGFCCFLNVINSQDEKPLCANCGLDLSRSAQLAPTRTSDEQTNIDLDAVLEDTDTDPIATLFAEAEEEPRSQPPATPAAVLSEKHRAQEEATVAAEGSPRRRRALHPWIIMSAFAVLITGATVVTWNVLSSPPGDVAAAQTPAPPAAQISLTGWTATPTWVSDIAAEATAESADGTMLLVATSDAASILDTATGDVIATRGIDGDGTPLTYWAGDTGVVVDGDTLHLWTSGAARGDTEDGGDKARWATTQLGDASLSLRGDAIFAVTEVGTSYERIAVDGSRDTVNVPTKGAVPVAATGDTIVWGTNKGVAYATDRGGNDSRDIALAAPSDTAKVSRWISGDVDHIYVVWSDGDAHTLSVHALSDGSIVSSHPLTADPDVSAISTRDGSHVAYAGLLIDRTTGAITETSRDIDGTVGERFVTTDPLALINPAGGATPLEGDDVTLVAMSPEGELLVSTGDNVASLAPDTEPEGAQKR